MKALRLQTNALRQQILKDSFIWGLVVHQGGIANHFCFNGKRHEAETWKTTVGEAKGGIREDNRVYNF